MSKTLLQIHFNFSGPFGEEMTQQLVGLAESINEEPASSGKSGQKARKTSKLAVFTCLNPKKRRRLILKNTLRV